MNTGRYVLSQILDQVHWQTLSRLVTRYKAEARVRHFGCRQQFTCMAFAQLTWREGLRDIETCLNARPKALYHLGFREAVAKSTLADANETRDWRLWEDLAKGLIKKGSSLNLDAVAAAGEYYECPDSGRLCGHPTIQVLNQSATISAPLAGTEGFTKTGAGLLFLTGDSTYTGTTTVSAGGLLLGDGGTSGTLQTTQVVNTIGAAGDGPSGGFEIRRLDAVSVAYPIVNPTNNQSVQWFPHRQ